MELAGGDADLRPHAELAAVGELGGRVDHQDGAVEPADEGIGRRRIFGDDRFRVAGGVTCDMVDRGIETGHHANRKDRVQVFRVPIRIVGRRDTIVDGARLRIPAQRAARLGERIEIRGSTVRAMARSMSKVSVAPQIPVRRILALKVTACAMSGSAAVWM